MCSGQHSSPPLGGAIWLLAIVTGACHGPTRVPLVPRANLVAIGSATPPAPATRLRPIREATVTVTMLSVLLPESAANPVRVQSPGGGRALPPTAYVVDERVYCPSRESSGKLTMPALPELPTETIARIEVVRDSTVVASLAGSCPIPVRSIIRFRTHQNRRRP